MKIHQDWLRQWQVTAKVAIGDASVSSLNSQPLYLEWRGVDSVKMRSTLIVEYFKLADVDPAWKKERLLAWKISEVKRKFADELPCWP